MNTSNILQRKAEKPAIYGGIIAILSVAIATLASAYFTLGHISASTIMQVQKNNAALWLVDVFPFFFILWGQYIGSVLAEEASSIITAKTNEIWNETEALRKKIKSENQHDPLTQLPNMGQFIQHLDSLVLSCNHSNNPGSFIQTLSGFITREHHDPTGICIILLDINNFKEINNTLGTQNGDVILKKVSQRLKNNFKDSKVFISRIGGDDFSLILPNTNGARSLKFIKKIRAVLKQPIKIQDLSLVLETSIGVSMYPQHGDTAQELLQHAEIAMYACKKDASSYVFYSPSLNTHDINDLILKAEIIRAFENDELCLHYQPKLDTKNQVHEVEALARWQHPFKGMIPPDTFIPIIVEKRLHNELLEKVLTLTLTQVNDWKKVGLHLRVAVNLTSFDLLNPKLPEFVAQKLAFYNLTADALKFEITESNMIENQELTLKTLNKFADMNIPTSIDDFGTGYSSFSYLSRLPVSEVKIDRVFITNINTNERDAKIIHGIIALAHSLSLTTVAEGIEDAATMVKLRKLGCDYIQGYYISKPLDGSSLTKWLQKWNKRTQKSITIKEVPLQTYR